MTLYRTISATIPSKDRWNKRWSDITLLMTRKFKTKPKAFTVYQIWHFSPEIQGIVWWGNPPAEKEQRDNFQVLLQVQADLAKMYIIPVQPNPKHIPYNQNLKSEAFPFRVGPRHTHTRTHTHTYTPLLLSE